MAVTTELPSSFAATLAAIRSRLPEGLASPRVGIVCGSGLSGLASHIREKIEIPYDDLEGFTRSTGECNPLNGSIFRK
jgi:purine-nucleoside phosphorylase